MTPSENKIKELSEKRDSDIAQHNELVQQVDAAQQKINELRQAIISHNFAIEVLTGLEVKEIVNSEIE